MTRDSDADFGRTLRHGRTLATVIVAIVLATAGIIGAAYAMARTEATSAVERAVTSDDGRKRVRETAEDVALRHTLRIESKIDALTRELRIDDRLARVEQLLNDRLPPRPEKRR